MLSCPRGHQWEAADEADAGGDSPSCPVCGLAVATIAAEEPSDSAPTVLQAAVGHATRVTATIDQAPPELPDFAILEEIGRGGMGIVYRARRLADGQIVAVKVIRKDRLLHEETVKRFRREAQAAARLDHPNIVHILDSDQAGDTHYIVMEFVDGVTLERYVELNGPLPIPMACDFLRQAALGLQHAHEQALVHRDIKPSNLMVTPAPQPGDAAMTSYQVKLLDMGVARVLQLSGQAFGEALSTLTQGGSVIGTADYIAPEQLEDPHGADIRADLYSLGCTFYFLLTGQVPFPGGSLISKLDKQRWQAATPPELLRGEIMPGLVRVVQKLMAKKPADRYQTPGELADALAILSRHNYDDPPLPRIELRELRRMIGHLDVVWSVRFAPVLKQIVSGGKDGMLLLWDAESGQLVHKFTKHPQEIRCVAFAPSGDQIASASGFTVRLFDVRGQEVKRFSGHSATIKCLAFAPDGKRLATGSDDKTIRVWDVHSGREVQRFSRHTAGITALAYVASSNHLASASRDQTVRLWDLKSGLEAEAFDAHAGNVLDIAVSANGKRLASAHFDTTIRLWSVETTKEIGQCLGHKQMVSALAFTHDGTRLLSAGQDQTLRLWDVATKRELACASSHIGGIHALSLSPDGTRVVTAGADRMLALSAMPKS
jgi:eukaryotic-like serine/threonine-protein kinase